MQARIVFAEDTRDRVDGTMRARIVFAEDTRDRESADLRFF
jgi:hypothetical protein